MKTNPSPRLGPLLGAALLLALPALGGCQEAHTPRPRGYFRIDLPPKSYRAFDKPAPYAFEMPDYARAQRDSLGFVEPYWYNLEFPQFRATLHLSYKPLEGNVVKYLEDSRDLAYKHAFKADAIGEQVFENPEQKVYGTLYQIEGETASALQFYLTDSLRHFVRGALYFNLRTNRDSLAPVLDFLEQDLFHMMETFEWREVPPAPAGGT